MIQYDFSGKTALITGASKGIGREIAFRLARSGARIAATARNKEELDSLKTEIADAGGNCELRICDLSKPEDIQTMVEFFIGLFGQIDLLVNNAGVVYPESILNTDIEHWNQTININLRAPLLVTKIAAADMAKRGEGAIVNISSNSGLVAFEEHGSYCASKHGLHGLSKVMAIELGPLGIRVNCVAPTVTLTPMGISVWGDPEKGDPMKAKIPTGRFAEPWEIADAVLFLLSDSAKMINGDVLVIDGGYTAR